MTIDLHNAGNSYGEIPKRLDIPRSILQSVIKKFVQFESAETLPGLDRKQNLTERTARKLFCEVDNNSRMELNNSANGFETEGTSVSKSTI